MSLISVVVPVYHNEGSLRDLHVALQGVAARHDQDTFEFIFVEDGSSDGSFGVLRALAQSDHRVRVVKLTRNFGSNPAILAGLAHARGDAVGAISADLQDPPETLDEMIALWKSGGRVVVAARADRDDPWLTTALADMFYRAFRRYAIATMPRHGFDFFLLDKSVVKIITNIQENNAYLMGLILWTGFTPAVVSYRRRARPANYGRSRWTLARKIKYFIDAFVAFSHVPVRAASFLGILCAAGGLGYAALVIFLRLVYGFPVEGWASLMVAMLILGGVQLLMLGVVGEYLWRALEETRKRPRYVVETIVDHTDAPSMS